MRTDNGQKKELSKDEQEELFKKDIKEVEEKVEELIDGKLSQNQFDALTSFTYNVGSTALKKSTLRKKINSSEETDKKEIQKEFQKWKYADNEKGENHVLSGLQKRREKEAHIFNKGYEGVVMEFNAKSK